MKTNTFQTATMLAVLSFACAIPTASVAVSELIERAESGNLSTRAAQAAGTFQAFDGNNCDKSAGKVVAIGGGSTCIGTGGRHSFRVTGCTQNVLLWTGGGCGGSFVQVNAANQCLNVNTGANWGSAGVQCA